AQVRVAPHEPGRDEPPRHVDALHRGAIDGRGAHDAAVANAQVERSLAAGQPAPAQEQVERRPHSRLWPLAMPRSQKLTGSARRPRRVRLSRYSGRSVARVSPVSRWISDLMAI